MTKARFLTLRSREMPFLSAPIPPSLLIGRCLRLGTGERVKDAQRRERPEIVEIVGHPPEDFAIAHLSASATYLRWMIDLCSV
jgi:hypothetical protein